MTDLTILSGDDSLTLPLLSIGARGVISVVGNIVPSDMIVLCKAFDAGNIAEAEVASEIVSAVPRYAGSIDESDSNQGGHEAIRAGYRALRLPMTPLEAANETKLRKTLTEYGLL